LTRERSAILVRDAAGKSPRHFTVSHLNEADFKGDGF
jgi:hypothetical protein